MVTMSDDGNVGFGACACAANAKANAADGKARRKTLFLPPPPPPLPCPPPTVPTSRLYDLIDGCQWDEATLRCRVHPQDAAWIKPRIRTTPIHWAIERRAPSRVVRAVLEAHPPFVDERPSRCLATPLHRLVEMMTFRCRRRRRRRDGGGDAWEGERMSDLLRPFIERCPPPPSKLYGLVNNSANDGKFASGGDGNGGNAAVIANANANANANAGPLAPPTMPKEIVEEIHSFLPNPAEATDYRRSLPIHILCLMRDDPHDGNGGDRDEWGASKHRVRRGKETAAAASAAAGGGKEEEGDVYECIRMLALASPRSLGVPVGGKIGAGRGCGGAGAGCSYINRSSGNNGNGSNDIGNDHDDGGNGGKKSNEGGMTKGTVLHLMARECRERRWVTLHPGGDGGLVNDCFISGATSSSEFDFWDTNDAVDAGDADAASASSATIVRRSVRVPTPPGLRCLMHRLVDLADPSVLLAVDECGRTPLHVACMAHCCGFDDNKEYGDEDDDDDNDDNNNNNDDDNGNGGGGGGGGDNSRGHRNDNDVGEEETGEQEWVRNKTIQTPSPPVVLSLLRAEPRAASVRDKFGMTPLGALVEAALEDGGVGSFLGGNMWRRVQGNGRRRRGANGNEKGMRRRRSRSTTTTTTTEIRGGEGEDDYWRIFEELAEAYPPALADRVRSNFLGEDVGDGGGERRERRVEEAWYLSTFYHVFGRKGAGKGRGGGFLGGERMRAALDAAAAAEDNVDAAAIEAEAEVAIDEA